MTRLGRPTGPKPGFTRAEVVAAALALGVADFTLAGVAARLGVATSALYRTISSREDLLRACLDEIAARIDFAPDPDDWRRNARNQADALWTELEASPGLDRVLLTVPWAAECFADTIGAAHRAFMAAGMSQEDAALAVDVVGDTVISSHVGVTALRADWRGGAGPRPGRGASALPAPFHLDPAWLERGWLDRKIDLLVDGLGARLVGAGRPPGARGPRRNRRKRRARPAENAHPVDNPRGRPAPSRCSSASAQVSSRTCGWEVRVRLETCALAEADRHHHRRRRRHYGNLRARGGRGPAGFDEAGRGVGGPPDTARTGSRARPIMVVMTERSPRGAPRPEPERDRALGALTGLALGDALGMPTQSMSPALITRHYGRIAGLRDAVGAQPIAPGAPAGSVTDDTEQALLIAELLIAGRGRIDPFRFADVLLAWEDRMRARGSLDLLGPSTKLALERVRAGADPRTTGRAGTTNGAAMRVAPVGIAFPLTRPELLADAVHASCVVTHDTRQGFESAALIAVAVSAAVGGADADRAVDAALDLVAALAPRGHWSPGASVVARARAALDAAEGLSDAALAVLLREQVGTSVESAESVPCALVIAREFAARPFEGLCFAASLGGDTDTIAAMAGAVLGAADPRALPADAVGQVLAVSGLDPAPACDGLLELRRASPARSATPAGGGATAGAPGATAGAPGEGAGR